MRNALIMPFTNRHSIIYFESLQYVSFSNISLHYITFKAVEDLLSKPNGLVIQVDTNPSVKKQALLVKNNNRQRMDFKMQRALLPKSNRTCWKRSS